MDDDETELQTFVAEQPIWRFSMWDVIGITLSGVAGALAAMSGATSVMAREFCAMANWKREQYDAKIEARKQATMARELDEIVNGEGK